MKAKVHLGSPIPKQIEKHIDDIIDSHIAARGWPRVKVLKDLILLLQTELDAIQLDESQNKPEGQRSKRILSTPP